MKESAASKILKVLEAAEEPLTVEEICRATFGTCGDRERRVVYQNLFRLDEGGRIEKFPIRYRLRR